MFNTTRLSTQRAGKGTGKNPRTYRVTVLWRFLEFIALSSLPRCGILARASTYLAWCIAVMLCAHGSNRRTLPSLFAAVLVLQGVVGLVPVIEAARGPRTNCSSGVAGCVQLPTPWGSPSSLPMLSAQMTFAGGRPIDAPSAVVADAPMVEHGLEITGRRRRLQKNAYNSKGYSLPAATSGPAELQHSRFAITSQVPTEPGRHKGALGVGGSQSRKCIACSMFTPTSPRNLRHEVRYATWIPQMVYSARTLFPDWEMLVYHDTSVFTDVLTPALGRIRPHATLILVEPPNYVRSGCFWRLYAFDVCDVVFWRDVELVFEPNDVFLVHDFLKRPQELAAVQAIHPRQWNQHRCVLAGIYLAKRNASHPNPIHMRTLIENQFLFWHYFGADEVFLCNTLHALRPSVVYYEPQQKVRSTVRLNNELSHMETYVELPRNYELIGQPGHPGNALTTLGLDVAYSDAWAVKFKRHFAQNETRGGIRELQDTTKPHTKPHAKPHAKPQSSAVCVARGRAVTWPVAAQCQGAAREPKNLMVVAHPDDELFFGFGTLASARCGEWLVLSVTNASPNSSFPEGKCQTLNVNSGRRFEFEAALRQLGAYGEMWDFQDRLSGFTPPEEADLALAVSEKLSTHAWAEVVTHNAQGEYGHAQHKQIHEIVLQAVKLARGSTRVLTFHLDVTKPPAHIHNQQKQMQIAKDAYPLRVVHLHNQLANWTKFATLNPVAGTHAATHRWTSVAGSAKKNKRETSKKENKSKQEGHEHREWAQRRALDF